MMARKNIPDALVCQVVSAMEQEGFRSERGHLIERLMQLTGECEKVCYCAAERTSSRAYIEYGVAIRWPWLTDKGRALLSVATGASQ